MQVGLQDIVNITMDYIAQVDPTYPSGFNSKHGQTEGANNFDLL